MNIILNIWKIKKYLRSTNTAFIMFSFLFTSLLVIIYMFYINLNHASNSGDQVIDNKMNFPISNLNKNKSINTMYALCNIFNCFNIYRCGDKGNELLVYVYPQISVVNSEKMWNSNVTKESQLILQAITESKFYTSNPSEACIFISSFDMLNIERRDRYKTHTLETFPFWRKGEIENHLIFNLVHENINNQNEFLHPSMGQAMIAGIGYVKSIYRKKFDISLPTLSILLEHSQFNNEVARKWLVILTQLNVNPDIRNYLIQKKNLFPEEFEIFQSCSQNNMNQSYRCINHRSYKYPEILETSTFCLVLRGEVIGLSILLEALAARCIPVIIFDTLVMPFDEVIDWSRAAIFIQENDVSSTINLLKSYSYQRINELQKHGTWLYNKYFKSIKIITETTLQIIADRIFPHSARNYYYWNEPEYLELGSPVFSPLTIQKNDGFTAIILTYDRIDLLFVLIHKLSKVPSLTKILVIWNNEYKKPPPLYKWPKISKIIKIIQTEKNLLSNRFYPFPEIETEAILSIDDDIIMLTEDEIEFAFEVWREFPDRIVGFPSRTHTWDNKTFSWKYESEWTNQISMVLTGAAFYHKYWNYAYTTKLPSEIKTWVDKHMNCEDIAMNFLISNVTKKAPIKVTAKKKFRCPECVNTEMLSADLTHMVERTQCINQFTKVFGHLPLLSVEFRADPVLFKDNFPDKLKRFNHVGSL